MLPSTVTMILEGQGPHQPFGLVWSGDVINSTPSEGLTNCATCRTTPVQTCAISRQHVVSLPGAVVLMFLLNFSV